MYGIDVLQLPVPDRVPSKTRIQAFYHKGRVHRDPVFFI